MLGRLTRGQWAAIAAACLAGAGIALALALVPADGGGGDDADLPDEPPGSEEVREAIEAAVETRDAEDCDRLATPGYLRQYERRGVSALAACQKGVFERDRGLLPSDVGIEVVEVGDAKAVALVTYRGGGQAGITARLPLVRNAKGRFVLARIPSFERATRRQMNRALAAEVASGPVAFGAEASRCAVREARSLSDRQLETFLLAAPAAELFTLVARCDPVAFARGVVDEVREAGLPIKPEREECYAQDLAGAPTRLLVQTLVGIEEQGTFGVALECRRN